MKTANRTQSGNRHHRTLTEPDTNAAPQTVELDDLVEFLRDPIAYGQYDWSDPITLAEFETSSHHRGRYVAPLVF